MVDVFEIGFVFYVFHRDKNNPGRACRQQGVTGLEIMTVPTTSQRWKIDQFPTSASAATLQ